MIGAQSHTRTDPHRLYTLDEVSELAHESRRTIRRRIAAGSLETVVQPGSNRRKVTRAALERYLAGS